MVIAPRKSEIMEWTHAKNKNKSWCGEKILQNGSGKIKDASLLKSHTKKSSKRKRHSGALSLYVADV